MQWNSGNNNSGYYPPPGGPPPPGPGGYGFPSPGGYGPPQGPPGDNSRGFGGGYDGGYGPPSGPPPMGNYGPPSGPPPGSGYPGQTYRDAGPSPNSMYDNNSYNNGGGGGGYQAPSGPPPFFNPDNAQFPYVPPGAPHMPPSQMQYYGPQSSTPGGQQVQPNFQYSQCTGKKKALLIGINYFGSNQELAGCINDANRMKQFIMRYFGYRDDDIVVLTDDARSPEQMPTRSNILRAMEWLVRFASPDDSLFFHYSGHGGLTKDLDGDEEDGYDEVIYPVDYDDAGHIVDDVMHEILVRPLPAGCRLTAVFDSCHSGSALDLPYIYSTEGKIKEPNLAAEAGQNLLGAGMAYMNKDYGALFKSVKGLVSVASGSSTKADKLTRQTRTSPADVISWSGCKDSQTSADTQVNGMGTGAMSWAFMESYSQNTQQSYQQLLVSIRSLLKSKYEQRPQLSSSHPMDTNIVFIA